MIGSRERSDLDLADFLAHRLLGSGALMGG